MNKTLLNIPAWAWLGQAAMWLLVLGGLRVAFGGWDGALEYLRYGIPAYLVVGLGLTARSLVTPRHI